MNHLPRSHADADVTWPARQGVALAICAAADVLTIKDLPVVSTFLIARALVGSMDQCGFLCLKCYEHEMLPVRC